MLYSNLLTRKSAVFSILFSVALASPAPQNAVSSAAAAAAGAVATSGPTCLGVGASIIPDTGVGPYPGAAEDSGFDSSGYNSGSSSSISSGGSSGGSSTSSASTSTSSNSGDDNYATARRGLVPGEMNNLLYERQDDSFGADDDSTGASNTPAMTTGPIQIPPNTTYCGWLGGTGMQSDMLLFNNPGTYQLTWQNVTGDGQVSINYAEAGADSTWADQESDDLSDLPTIVAFPNSGIQYQVVYYGAYADNGLSWFLTQVA